MADFNLSIIKDLPTKRVVVIIQRVMEGIDTSSLEMGQVSTLRLPSENEIVKVDTYLLDHPQCMTLTWVMVRAMFEHEGVDIGDPQVSNMDSLPNNTSIVLSVHVEDRPINYPLTISGPSAEYLAEVLPRFTGLDADTLTKRWANLSRGRGMYSAQDVTTLALMLLAIPNQSDPNHARLIEMVFLRLVEDAAHKIRVIEGLRESLRIPRANPSDPDYIQQLAKRLTSE
jgi:hypothetical protein